MKPGRAGTHAIKRKVDPVIENITPTLAKVVCVLEDDREPLSGGLCGRHGSGAGVTADRIREQRSSG